MSRSLSSWIGIAAICAAILLVPLVGGVKEGMSGISFYPTFGGFLPRSDGPRHDRDCKAFESRREAQRFFVSHGGPQRDPHLLDANTARGRDGRACGEFDYRRR